MECIFHEGDSEEELKLGKTYFENNSGQPRFIERQNSKRSEVYRLGNGRTTENALEAAIELMARDYPDVKMDHQDKVHFVPNMHFSIKPDIISHNLKNLPEDMIKFKATLIGDKFEKVIFNKLQEYFKNDKDKKEVFVFHKLTFRWDVERPNRRGEIIVEEVKGEFDFLIILRKWKTIVNIECKNSPKLKEKTDAKTVEGSCLKAAKQLEKFRLFLQDNFGFDSDWSYVKAVCFSERSGVPLCPECQPNVIWSTDKDALKMFFNRVLTQKPISNSEETDLTYKDIVRDFLYFALRNRQIVSRAGTSLEMMRIIQGKVGTPKNILFWNKEQNSLLKNSEMLRVVFDCAYGTGKTEMLKAKAKQLAEYGGDVVFLLVRDSDKPTILKAELEKFFENQQGRNSSKVSLIPISSSELVSAVAGYQRCHLFIDEIPQYKSPKIFDLNIGSCKTRHLKSIFKSRSDKNEFYTWVAFTGRHKKDSFFDRRLTSSTLKLPQGKNIHRAQLDIPMRNSSSIAKFAQDYSKGQVLYRGLMPSNLPPGQAVKMVCCHKAPSCLSCIESAVSDMEELSGGRGPIILILSSNEGTWLNDQKDFLEELEVKYQGRVVPYTNERGRIEDITFALKASSSSRTPSNTSIGVTTTATTSNSSQKIVVTTEDLVAGWEAENVILVDMDSPVQAKAGALCRAVVNLVMVDPDERKMAVILDGCKKWECLCGFVRQCKSYAVSMVK